MKVYRKNIREQAIAMYHEYMETNGVPPDFIEMTRSEYISLAEVCNNECSMSAKRNPHAELTGKETFLGMKIVIKN